MSIPDIFSSMNISENYLKGIVCNVWEKSFLNLQNAVKLVEKRLKKMYLRTKCSKIDKKSKAVDVESKFEQKRAQNETKCQKALNDLTRLGVCALSFYI